MRLIVAMRKILLVTAAVFLFVPSQSRAELYRLWDVSLYGGFTLAMDNGTASLGSLGTNSGIGFGLGVAYRFSPAASLGVDILYLSKGYTVQNLGGTTRYDLNYVEFPVQIFYQASNVVALHGGIVLPSLVVSSNRVTNGTSTPDRQDFSNDYGLTAGIRFGFRATARLYIGADFRYDFGLANILNDNDPTHSVHTRAFFGLSNLTFSF